MAIIQSPHSLNRCSNTLHCGTDSISFKNLLCLGKNSPFYGGEHLETGFVNPGSRIKATVSGSVSKNN